MSASVDIGERLGEAIRNIDFEIGELQDRREALFEAWRKWDLTYLYENGYISLAQKTASEKELQSTNNGGNL